MPTLTFPQLCKPINERLFTCTDDGTSDFTQISISDGHTHNPWSKTVIRIPYNSSIVCLFLLFVLFSFFLPFAFTACCFAFPANSRPPACEQAWPPAKQACRRYRKNKLKNRPIWPRYNAFEIRYLSLAAPSSKTSYLYWTCYKNNTISLTYRYTGFEIPQSTGSPHLVSSRWHPCWLQLLDRWAKCYSEPSVYRWFWYNLES